MNAPCRTDGVRIPYSRRYTVASPHVPTKQPQVCTYEVLSEIGHVSGSELVKECHDFLADRHENSHSIVYTMHFSKTYSCMTTLRPTDAEAEQPYFSTLVSYDDPPVPVFDDIARTIIVLQFNTSHADSGNGRQSTRQDSDDGVAHGGSGEDETSRDDDGDGQSGSDRDSDDTEDTIEGTGDRSSDGEDTRRGETSTSSTPQALRVTSPV
ncbi:Hypothetical predicted protein [Olea europaea subsp. europaea]|uniref:Uncharacterized protein n=1 Tax=Olea europaea subsp. europaea TaxID=158383 RepID=A0A8S0RRA0_OLEEU|nr:Hypothetical predicted protein [Olea europaea subsp. europaea]